MIYFVGCKVLSLCLKSMLFGDVFELLLVIVCVAVLNYLLHSKFKLLSKN